MKKNAVSICIIITIIVMSCNSSQKQPPVDLSKVKTKKEVISIPYREINGVKTIPVKLNGVSMDMIYDTGCSGVHLSLLELQTLYKNGKFSENDVIGTSLSQIADGSVVQNGEIILREIEIGGEDGIVLPNVEASVSLNLEAPILLGNGVLDKVAAVEVDNVKKTINFKRY
jgi:predicted aspartyl protease